MLLCAGTVAVYGYGRLQPPRQDVTVRATLRADAPTVWELLSDPERRPEWRPQVHRVGRVSDDADGHEVWRELDRAGDRFDFAIVERRAPEHLDAPDRAASPSARPQADRHLRRWHLVLRVASTEQIGMQGQWSWTVTSAPDQRSTVLLSESTSIDNPLFRGLHRLTRDPYDNVEREIVLLATHLGTAVELERL